MQVEALDHIHIYAEDPEASVTFYERHFEAQEVHRDHNVNGDLRIYIGLGGQILVLGSFPAGLSPATPPPPGDGAYGHGFGVAHIGLRVADVPSSTAELSELGVRILGEPVREASGLSYAYVAAPDGVVIELTQYAVPA